MSERTYVSSLERGLKSPTLEKVADLAAALDVHPLTLLALTYVRRGENLHALLSRIERESESLDQD